MAPTSLIFLFTLHCPLECDHCIVDSSPRRKEGLANDFVLNAIDEAAAAGITSVGFTGGDPFSRRDDLAAFVRKAKTYSMDVMVVTSAFWARSEALAVRHLSRVEGIDLLGLSTDVYHHRFTPLANITNAIRAAKQCRIPVELQVVYTEDEQVESIREALGDDLAGVQVRRQKLWPVGRAAKYQAAALKTAPNLDDLDMTCPMGAPVITPDRKLKGCCSSLLNLGSQNPLILANLEEQTLKAALFEGTRMKHYQFLRTFGLSPVVELIRRADKADMLAAKYTDACHLCHDIHSQPPLAALIRETFQG